VLRDNTIKLASWIAATLRARRCCTRREPEEDTGGRGMAGRGK
jgi:hypothetical protein